MRSLPAVVLVALLPLAPATARAGEPTGLLCGFTTVLDPTDQSGRRSVAEIDGGPIVLDADPAGQPVWGSITCTIQEGPNVRHGDPDLARATSPVTPGAAYLPPTPVPYEADPSAFLWMCTQVDVAGRGTYYWSSTATADGGGWSTDPNALCDGAISLPEDDPFPRDLVAQLLVSAGCPPLTLVLPPEGDVPGVLDCPPYGSA